MPDNKFAQIADSLFNAERRLKMFVGIDGFVDEIIHAVDKRSSFDEFTKIETISGFAERIARASGLSANIELVPVNVKLGGNGPIYANALKNCGVDIVYTGSLGKSAIHPVFKDFAQKCEVYSICEPGHTDALEFNDGKLMLGKTEQLNELTWQNLSNVFGGADRLSEIISSCDLFAMTNWTMVAHMNEIWEGVINEVFPKMSSNSTERPIAFFDLADPEKRNSGDILNALKLIADFGKKFRTVLGLNEKEAYEIAEVLNVKTDKTQREPDKLKSVVTSVYEKLNIDCLVVHPVKSAAACTKDGYFYTPGPFCEKPVLTTGAGDNFNAGFCLALCLGLDIYSSLVAGVSTSGYYVRNAKSPTFPQLCDFISHLNI